MPARRVDAEFRECLEDRPPVSHARRTDGPPVGHPRGEHAARQPVVVHARDVAEPAPIHLIFFSRSSAHALVLSLFRTHVPISGWRSKLPSPLPAVHSSPSPRAPHLEHLECSDQPHIQDRGAKKRTQRARSVSGYGLESPSPPALFLSGGGSLCQCGQRAGNTGRYFVVLLFSASAPNLHVIPIAFKELLPLPSFFVCLSRLRKRERFLQYQTTLTLTRERERMREIRNGPCLLIQAPPVRLLLSPSPCVSLLSSSTAPLPRFQRRKGENSWGAACFLRKWRRRLGQGGGQQ